MDEILWIYGITDLVTNTVYTVENLNKFCYPCSMHVLKSQRKVHFLYAKNLPAELPGYSLDLASER